MENKPNIVPFERKADILKDALNLLNTLAAAIKAVEGENGDSEPLHLALERLNDAYMPPAVRKERKNVQRFYNAIAGQPTNADADALAPDMEELRSALNGARTALTHSGLESNNVIDFGADSSGHS